MEQFEEPSVRELSTPDAWAFVTRHELGRLAYVVGRDVMIAPVNYALMNERILIRTAPGSKLLGVLMHPEVAFEVDEVGQDRATSVVLRGPALHLDDRQVAATAPFQPRSWVDTAKYEVIAIHVTEITGRSFRLTRGPSNGG